MTTGSQEPSIFDMPLPEHERVAVDLTKHLVANEQPPQVRLSRFGPAARPCQTLEPCGFGFVNVHGNLMAISIGEMMGLIYLDLAGELYKPGRVCMNTCTCIHAYIWPVVKIRSKEMSDQPILNFQSLFF